MNDAKERAPIEAQEQRGLYWAIKLSSGTRAE
jgi:hypothetical protein